jgi:hypothetical protein
MKERRRAAFSEPMKRLSQHLQEEALSYDNYKATAGALERHAEEVSSW